jgi:hypothetical protein
MSVVALHTGEGSTIEGIVATLKQNNSMSNEVYDPTIDRTVSLIPAGTASRSLRNLNGGVQTNNRESDGRPGADVYQIEIVGFASLVAGYSDQWYRNLANHVAAVCFLTGTPLEFPCKFEAYPPRDGIRLDGREPWRLTNEQWLNVNGVIGHQHIPENVHGDPGDLSRMVALLTEEDMALTDDELDKIAARVWTHQIGTQKDGPQPASAVVGWTKDEIDRVYGKGGLVDRVVVGVLAALPPATVNNVSVVNEAAITSAVVAALRSAKPRLDVA